MKKKMKKTKIDKNLIIWVLILLLPIIFTIVAIGIKSTSETKNISRITYVHIFYVKDTDVKEEVKETLTKISDKHKIVYHDINAEGDLFKKVIDYFGITERVYNPLIVINNNYFTEEYDKYSLQNAIKEANKTYEKDNLSREEILKYDVVDRLETGEEIYDNGK